MRRRLFFLICIGVALFSERFASAADALPLSELAHPGRVLIVRHALAPGVGDPPNLQLDDCSTQRNLNDAGRAQARALGARLMAAGVTQASVYSSEWCRCRETAQLLALGPVEPLQALNSFFGRPDAQVETLAALRGFLARLPTDGAPVVLVTHQVTVSGLTGRGTPAGSGSIFQLNGTDSPQWLGVIDPK